ncbi:MAG: ABC transporter ATP-binding protein [Wenzhouxiangellaceae bacterium]
MTDTAGSTVSAAPEQPLIRARALSKRYGAKRALDDVNLDIPAGRIVGLIGPNGAGKTTCLKAILGMTPFQGELSVLGMHPQKDRNQLMEQVSFIADVAVLPRWIRVNQLIELTAALHPRFSTERCEALLAMTDVKPDDKVKSLSKGMIVQLHLALIMAIDAKLLILDEPTLGLDILYRKQFYSQLLNDYFDEQRTIIITTHQVEEIEHILTDVIFVQHGKVVLNHDIDELQQIYAEVAVNADNADKARALGPIAERSLLGRHVFLFKDRQRSELAQLGEIHTPSIVDLFVAVMRGGKS